MERVRKDEETARESDKLEQEARERHVLGWDQRRVLTG